MLILWQKVLILWQNCLPVSIGLKDLFISALIDIWVGWESSFAVSWDYRSDKNERTYRAAVGHNNYSSPELGS